MSHGVLFPFAPRFGLLLGFILIQTCLVLGPWTPARAQLDVGIGVGSRGGGERDHDIGRERERNRNIGIGIEIGRAIDQNATVPAKGAPSEPKKYGRKDDNKKKKDGDGKTARTDDKKTDDKKTDDKKDDKKKPAQDVATVDDCLMIIQYAADEEIAPDGATNTDIKGSTQALKASLKGTNDEQTITKENKIQDALKKLTAGNKCCKRIMIFGHGYEDGSLKLPYPTYEGGEGDKPKHLGGAAMQLVDGKKAFKDFSEQIKSALCKDPKSGKLADGAEVRIHACWSADTNRQDHPISEELSKTGVTSWGYKDVVRFPYSAPEGKPDEREYSPPRPNEPGEFQKLDGAKVSAK